MRRTMRLCALTVGEDLDLAVLQSIDATSLTAENFVFAEVGD